MIFLGMLMFALLGIPKAFLSYMGSMDGPENAGGGSGVVFFFLLATAVNLAAVLGIYIYGCVGIVRRRLISARWRPLAELYDFLGSALERNEPVADALQAFAADSPGDPMKRALESVAARVRGNGGVNLAEALGAADDFFPASDRAVVRAAEGSNALPQAMRFLARTRNVSAEANPTLVLYIAQAAAAVLLTIALFLMVRGVPSTTSRLATASGAWAMHSAAAFVLLVAVAMAVLFVLEALFLNLLPMLRGLASELPAAQLAAATSFANAARRAGAGEADMQEVWAAIGGMRQEAGPALGKIPVVGQQLLAAGAPAPGETPPDMQAAGDSLLRRAGLSVQQGGAIPFYFCIGWILFFVGQLLVNQAR